MLDFSMGEPSSSVKTADRSRCPWGIVGQGIGGAVSCGRDRGLCEADLRSIRCVNLREELLFGVMYDVKTEGGAREVYGKGFSGAGRASPYTSRTA